MATGFFGYGGGSDGGGLLKRSLTELERQQQIQHALFLRSVKRRTEILNSPSSSSASSGISFDFLREPQKNPKDCSFTPPSSSSIKSQLQDLERQLLFDDDDVSAAGSAVTSEWSDVLSPKPPSPTTSSSSSTTASCSPNPPASSKQLLLETATAISESNLEIAAANLAALKRAGNPRGDPDQRLASMMISALIARINSPPPVTLTSPASELCSLEHQTAIQMLYDASPIFKLGHVAANFAILDAAKDHSKIHVVDFDLGQGVQYASLIYAVAERSRHRLLTPLVKLTAVCDPALPHNTPSTVNNLKIIGNKIVALASRFGVPVRFNVLNRRASELDRVLLGCEPDECLAVNLSFILSRIADESVSPANPRDQLLRRVKSLGPGIVTLVEQEMNANTAPFATRFSEACNYYGSVLDSLDATMSRDDRNRFRIECALGRKVGNSIAREGGDRVERAEVFGKWRARMSMAGFGAVQLGSDVIEPVRVRFGSMKANPGFTLEEEAGRVGFGWMGRVLTVASAWR